MGKGRILKIRMGINPNSSGHGILWAAIFFLPQVFFGALTAAFSLSLSWALQEDCYKHMTKWLTGLVWWGAWTSFAYVWLQYALQVIAVRASERVLLLHLPISILCGLAMAVVAYRYLPASLTNLTKALAVSVPAALLAIAVFSYVIAEMPALLSVPLVYALVVLSLKERRRAWLHLATYVLGAFCCLIFFPYPRSSYNPVGFFFPYWGMGYPAFVVVRELWPKMKATEVVSGEDTNVPCE